ncbi:MAG TPA: hypothetical protein VFA34_16170 [Actinomycetota bacterium]|nr:hypothetical protein [Actinomycetota bacterium]
MVFLALVACGREAPDATPVAVAAESPTPRPILSPSPSPTRAPTPTPLAWKRADERTFSFEVPADMKKEDVQGIDSQVGRYHSETLFLGYDYGWYGSDCTKEHGDEAERRGEVTTIDGREAKMIFLAWKDPSIEHSHWACVFFPNVGKEGAMTTSLVLSVSGEDRETWTAARRIFESIRFAR